MKQFKSLDEVIEYLLSDEEDTPEKTVEKYKDKSEKVFISLEWDSEDTHKHLHWVLRNKDKKILRAIPLSVADVLFFRNTIEDYLRDKF